MVFNDVYYDSPSMPISVFSQHLAAGDTELARWQQFIQPHLTGYRKSGDLDMASMNRQNDRMTGQTIGVYMNNAKYAGRA